MVYVTKQREKLVTLLKSYFHPEGDCVCTRPMRTGRKNGGSEICRNCGHCIGKHKWHQPEGRTL